MLGLRALLVLACLFAPVRAFADDPPPLTPLKLSLATGAVLFPGVILHGSGHYVLGEKETARKLLIAEGVGLVAGVGGIAGIAVSGASKRLMNVLTPLTVAGFGLFFSTFLADLYGVTLPRGWAGEPIRVAPWISTSTGARYLNDPNFRYDGTIHQRVDLRWRALRLGGLGEWAFGDANRRYGAELAYRFVGPTPQRDAADGSYVDLRAGYVNHAYDADGFTNNALEWSVDARLDLVRFARTLKGSFIESSLGSGFVSTRTLDRNTDTWTQLIARIAYGVYLGQRGQGEAVVAYNHRRDGYLGGLKPGGVGAAVFGSVTINGHWFFVPSVGVGAEVGFGSAISAGASLLFRQGARP